MKAIWGVLALVSLTAFDFGGVKGNGNIQQQTRAVGQFKGVAVSHGVHAQVKIGSETRVSVKGDSNLLALLDLEVKDGTLETKFKEQIRPTRPIELEITTPSLEAVAASGGSHVTAAATSSRRFDVAGSGGSIVRVDAVRAEEVAVAASGGSRVTLSGTSRSIAISSSGGSKVRAGELVAEEAGIQGSGGSDVEAHAKKRVEGALSGGSEATVHGRPTSRSVATSGASSLNFDS